jgi:hypothetical protein
VDFRGTPRTNDTHASTTDPIAALSASYALASFPISADAPDRAATQAFDEN